MNPNWATTRNFSRIPSAKRQESVRLANCVVRYLIASRVADSFLNSALQIAGVSRFPDKHTSQFIFASHVTPEQLRRERLGEGISDYHVPLTALNNDLHEKNVKAHYGGAAQRIINHLRAHNPINFNGICRISLFNYDSTSPSELCVPSP